MATLRGLVEQNVEELKVLQTIMLLASSTEHIRGKIVSQVSVYVRTDAVHLHLHKRDEREVSERQQGLVHGAELVRMRCHWMVDWDKMCFAHPFSFPLPALSPNYLA